MKRINKLSEILNYPPMRIYHFVKGSNKVIVTEATLKKKGDGK